MSDDAAARIAEFRGIGPYVPEEVGPDLVAPVGTFLRDLG